MSSQQPTIIYTLTDEAPLLATFPLATAEYYAGQGLVRILPIRLDRIRLPIAVVWRKSHVRWPALDLFIGAVRRTAHELESASRASEAVGIG